MRLFVKVIQSGITQMRERMGNIGSAPQAKIVLGKSPEKCKHRRRNIPKGND